MDSLVCQKALTENGGFVSGKTRAIREAGEANTFSIYLNKNEEEREREQQRANPSKGQNGNEGNKGKGAYMEPSATSLPGLANWHLSPLIKLHIGFLSGVIWWQPGGSEFGFGAESFLASVLLFDPSF